MEEDKLCLIPNNEEDEQNDENEIKDEESIKISSIVFTKEKKVNNFFGGLIFMVSVSIGNGCYFMPNVISEFGLGSSLIVLILTTIQIAISCYFLNKVQSKYDPRFTFIEIVEKCLGNWSKYPLKVIVLTDLSLVSIIDWLLSKIPKSNKKSKKHINRSS